MLHIPIKPGSSFALLDPFRGLIVCSAGFRTPGYNGMITPYDSPGAVCRCMPTVFRVPGWQQGEVIPIEALVFFANFDLWISSQQY